MGTEPTTRDLPSHSGELLDLRNHVIQSMVHGRGSALNQDLLDSPQFGKTKSFGNIKIQLECGVFDTYLFETSVHDHHVLALTMGDISSSEPILVRMHSECITSETLGGCDCDCVEQLNTALKKIAEEGRGILFYLRQEGRNAGYGSKARDREMVCASNSEIGTYDAYRELGLAPDLRDYSSLKEITYLLGINAPFRLMTNNPDKINGLRSSGFNISEAVQIFHPENPFNARYLSQKGEYGHTYSSNESIEFAHLPLVEPFKPHRLAGALRIEKMARYPLPLKTTSGNLFIDEDQYQRLLLLQAEYPNLFAANYEQFPGSHKVTIDPKYLDQQKIKEYLQLHPYIFDTYVYTDSATLGRGKDYVVLSYDKAPNKTPLVRVHSESILDRLPLHSDISSDTYQRSVQAILDHGRGMIVLAPNEGRGKGLGIEFLERRAKQLGVATSDQELNDLLGAPKDNRDYSAVALLIRQHYGKGNIDLIFNCADSVTEKRSLIAQLNQLEIFVPKYTILNGEN